MLLSFTSIPLLNLFLIYSQEYSKNKETKLGASKSGRDDDGAGNFTNYYITIGVYLLVTVNFVVFSFQF